MIFYIMILYIKRSSCKEHNIYIPAEGPGPGQGQEIIQKLANVVSGSLLSDLQSTDIREFIYV
jgi:hypothetical protein